ncbi:hypothetical protein KAR91_85355 [Candidatus Pacearchaeota archaeon]|nr:hypothetical protein [Candidatus Pacearchaeota archaeon]
MHFFKRHQWIKENRLIFMAGETPDFEPEVMDFSQEDIEGMEELNFDEAMSQADDMMYETIDEGEEGMSNAEEEERTWGEAIADFVGLETFKSFDSAQEAFENHDTAVAAKVFADVMELSNSGKGAQDSIDKVEAEYGPVTTAGIGKNLAYAVLIKMGMKLGNHEDFTRASKGEHTLQNMKIDVDGETVASIRNALLPNSYTNQAVKAMTGQKELEGYQRILLTPANAIEGVATSFLKLPSTLMALGKMGTDLAKNPNLEEIGVKGDLIMKIIDQYFSPAEKVAMIGQFLVEGALGMGIGSAISKLAKISKVSKVLNAINKVKFPKIILATSRNATKIGTSATIGRATSA